MARINQGKPCDTCTHKWQSDGLECEGQQYCNDTQEACGPYSKWKGKREIAKEILEWADAYTEKRKQGCIRASSTTKRLTKNDKDTQIALSVMADECREWLKEKGLLE